MNDRVHFLIITMLATKFTEFGNTFYNAWFISSSLTNHPMTTIISTTPSVPISPGVGALHPDRIVDICVRGSIPDWKNQARGSLKAARVLFRSIPFNLDSGTVPSIPATKFPVTLSASFNGTSDAAVAALSAALKAGHIVDIDVPGYGEENWEKLEDFLTKATSDASGAGFIILCDQSPTPPHDLGLPIVKLLTHPTYHSYQSHIATFSLLPRVYLSYTPPTWNAPTPPTPLSDQGVATPSKEKKEWKRRIKMYLGPALEAFGFERILFGSSPSPSSHASSSASFAEIGVEQSSIDAVFGGTAQRIYSSLEASV
ncbi:hypothetical protein BGW80DRAFT_1281017 [Lactifluus volemus]|nr:hypothetical protein BGW80DRAFT_1281017 [Lactifluus volemus]